MAEPGRTYDNQFTRMIERVTNDNAMGRVESVVGESLPSVRSAAMAESVLPPLTDAERAELDAKAIEAGIMPGPEGEEADAQYTSLADAQAAGSPIEYTPRAMMSKVAREPRLPNFAEVGGIDLIRGVVYIDSMEFPIDPEDIAELRLYVVNVAKKEITKRLEEALKLFAPESADDAEGMSEVSKS